MIYDIYDMIYLLTPIG